MKALSLWQPWASALFTPHKRIETRGWSTSYRGKLLIHAAKTWNRVCKQSLYELQHDDTLPISVNVDLYPLGVLLGSVELVNVRPTNELRPRISDSELRLGDFADGRFGWITENPQRFDTPIPYSGKQGLFDVPREVVEAAERRVGV